MKKTRRSVELIIRMLWEADGGENNEAVCRKHGISGTIHSSSRSDWAIKSTAVRAD